MSQNPFPAAAAAALLAAASTLHAGPAIIQSDFASGGSASGQTAEDDTLTLTSETGLPVAADVAGAAGAAHFPGTLGQIMEIETVQVSTATVPESAETFLSPLITMTDGTRLSEPAAEIEWTVTGGPLLDAKDGNVKAVSVYQDTPAGIEALVSGLYAGISLTVQETTGDNFGPYAGDSIPDTWQVQIFGPDNPRGHGSADPDGDGQDNLFEYTAGLDPVNAASYFQFGFAPAAGGGVQLEFQPRFNDLIYTVRSSTSLTSSSWVTLSGTIADSGTVRKMLDPDSSARRKFYRVDIVRP